MQAFIDAFLAAEKPPKTVKVVKKPIYEVPKFLNERKLRDYQVRIDCRSSAQMGFGKKVLVIFLEQS